MTGEIHDYYGGQNHRPVNEAHTRETMSEELRLRIIGAICRIREKLQSRRSFFADPEVRGVYVTLLTLESAIMFGDARELGSHCARFAEIKEKENRGGPRRVMGVGDGAGAGPADGA